jgi:cytoskeletal protein RodZ
MKTKGIAFVLLLILAVGIMAAYVLQWQQASDDDIETEEQAAESVNSAPAADPRLRSKNIEDTCTSEGGSSMDEMVSGSPRG